MEKLVRTVLAVFFLLGIASAQHIPEIDVFGGFSYFSYDNTAPASADAANRLSMKGGDASVAIHVWRHVFAEGNFGYDRLNDCNTENGTCSDLFFMAGPRFNFGSGSGRFTPFLHGLIGKDSADVPCPYSNCSANVSSGDSSVAFAAGGGVNYWFSHHIGIGAGGDWFYTRHLNSFDAPSQNTSLRAAFGITFRFGGETAGGERTTRSKGESSSRRHPSRATPVPPESQPPVAAAQPSAAMVSVPGRGMELPALGVVVAPQEFEGAKILEIVPGGVAEMASLKVGDLIRSVDGKVVKTPMELAAELSDKSGKVRIGILRGDVATETLVLLGR